MVLSSPSINALPRLIGAEFPAEPTRVMLMWPADPEYCLFEMLKVTEVFSARPGIGWNNS